MFFAIIFVYCGRHNYEQPVIDPKNKLDVDPCGEFYDDECFMRDYGMGTNHDPAKAQQISLSNAKDNLRQHMAEYVQGLTKTYSYQTSESIKTVDNIYDKVENKMDAKIDDILNRARKICQKREKDYRGIWVYYTAIEIPVNDFKNNIIQQMGSLSNEEKRIIDFDEQKFSQEMDKEYSKMVHRKKRMRY